MFSRSFSDMAPATFLLILLTCAAAVNAAPGLTDYRPVTSVKTVYTTTTATVGTSATITGKCTPLATPNKKLGDKPKHEDKSKDGAGKRSKRSLRVDIRADSTCGNLAVNAPKCVGGSDPICTCVNEKWDCNCPVPTTIVKTITKARTVTTTGTYTLDGGECPPTQTPTPERKCPDGFVKDRLIFDDFYDGQSGIKDPIRTPNSPFKYRGFTFDPDWSFGFCSNFDDDRDQSCNPATIDGDYYISLYYHLAKPFLSRVSRRITYDLENDVSSWEVLSYSLTVFPKPGQIITVLLCAWSVDSQDKDIEPSFCHAEYFIEQDRDILRKVEIGNTSQELAFIEFTAYDGYYAPGTYKDAVAKSKGLAPAEFFLDDLLTCVPDN